MTKLENIKSKVNDAEEFARKIWLAGLGAYGKSLDEVQSNFEKIFKIGTIEINTNDSPSLEISLKGIKNPMTIARAIKDRASKEGLMIYRNSAGKKKNEWLTKATRKG